MTNPATTRSPSHTRRRMLAYGLSAACIASTAALTPMPATAAGFPERTIKIVVNFPPGGPLDIIARLLAARMTTTLKQAVVVENVTGAAGNIGAAQVARATPDGYTILLSLDTPFTLTPTLNPTGSVNNADFRPIGLGGVTGSILAVHPSLGVDKLQALIDKGRTQMLTFSTAGNGSPGHFGALMLADHYTRVGELDQAEHHYRRTLKMDRQANYARLQLSRLYNAQGRNPEALAVLDEASKVDPENARIPYDKALLYAELDRMDDALAAFTEADRLKLESDRLYVNLSALHQQQGNSEAAVQALSRGLQRFPRSLDLLAEMTALLAREGRPREARTFLQRLRDLAPQDPRLMGLEDFVRRLEG